MTWAKPTFWSLVGLVFCSYKWGSTHEGIWVFLSLFYVLEFFMDGVSRA